MWQLPTTWNLEASLDRSTSARLHWMPLQTSKIILTFKLFLFLRHCLVSLEVGIIMYLYYYEPKHKGNPQVGPWGFSNGSCYISQYILTLCIQHTFWISKLYFLYCPSLKVPWHDFSSSCTERLHLMSMFMYNQWFISLVCEMFINQKVHA